MMTMTKNCNDNDDRSVDDDNAKTMMAIGNGICKTDI